MKKLDVVLAVFSEPKTRMEAILVSSLIFLLFGAGVALIPNPIFVRMIPSTPLDYLFLGTTSVLGGIYFAYPNKKACSADKSAFGGSMLGFLSFACPTCDKLLLFVLGPAFLLGILNPLRPLIGLLSVAVLVFAINKKIEGDAR